MSEPVDHEAVNRHVHGHHYGGYSYPPTCHDAPGTAYGYGLLWSDADTASTGRAPADLFVLPSEIVTFGNRVSIGGGPFVSIPTVSYLQEDEGAEDRAFECLADAGPHRDYLTLEATARRCESVIGRTWKHLTGAADGTFTFMASALLVLAAETEPHLTPVVQRRRFGNGLERDIEWYGLAQFHDALRSLWKSAVSGASVRDVLDNYDDLTRTYPVPVALGAAQRSVLAYCLTERDKALPEVRRAAAEWRQAEAELERTGGAQPVLPAWAVVLDADGRADWAPLDAALALAMRNAPGANRRFLRDEFAAVCRLDPFCVYVEEHGLSPADIPLDSLSRRKKHAVALLARQSSDL